MASIETYAKPTWLYRYRPIGLAGNGSLSGKNAIFSREVDALIGQQVYCPPYHKMNDPMEGIYRSSNKATSSKNYERAVSEIYNRKTSMGIACFSETWDNELMWAQYADAFLGICICYSMSGLLSGLSEEHAFARVAYGDKPYLINLPALKSGQQLERAVLSTKQLCWSYEREWRLFAPKIGPAEHGEKAIKSIYLGARIPKEARQEIVGKLKVLGIPIYRTKVDGYTVVKDKRMDRLA